MYTSELGADRVCKLPADRVAGARSCSLELGACALSWKSRAILFLPEHESVLLCDFGCTMFSTPFLQTVTAQYLFSNVCVVSCWSRECGLGVGRLSAGLSVCVPRLL